MAHFATYTDAQDACIILLTHGRPLARGVTRVSLKTLI